MPLIGGALQRLLCNFNVIALALLAFQNAGYIVLMGLAQQLQKAPAADGEPARTKFSDAHFLATTEFVKLLFCAVWCVVETLQEMRREEYTALIANAEVEDPSSCTPGDGTADTAGRKAVLATRDGLHHTATSRRTSPASRAAAAAFPGTPSKHAERYDDFPLTRLLARPNFTAQFASRLRHAIGLDGKYTEALLMIVPAVLYTIQGLLLILALKYLDPTVFQILYQVRIMFLAVMMRVVLDFQLSQVRWLALVGLMAGIILAQLAMQGSGKSDKAKSVLPDQPHSSSSWSVEGTLAALAGAFLSSFSGVFMEYVYKRRGSVFHLSARSLHLAFFSLVYFAFVFARDVWQSGADGSDGVVAPVGRLDGFFSTFFEGFTGLVWFLVVLQAMGGILVGLVVRYCDNIVKSFSTAFAIVLSGMASVFLFNLPLEPIFLLGSLLVMGSITVYSIKK